MRKNHVLYSRNMGAVLLIEVLHRTFVKIGRSCFVCWNASRLVKRHLHPGLNQLGIQAAEAIHKKNFARSH